MLARAGGTATVTDMASSQTMTPGKARQLLALSLTHTPDDARRAYKRRLRQTHPDTGVGEIADLTKAFQTLQPQLKEAVATATRAAIEDRYTMTSALPGLLVDVTL